MKNSNILIASFAITILATTANAAVVDQKTATHSPFNEPSAAEMGKTKLFNDISAMDINLRAVQEAFDKSANDENVAYFTYRPDFTAKVRLRVGMRTIIHFDENETIKSFIVGNPAIFKIIGIQDENSSKGIIPYMLTVKAVYPGADTNLTVLTESGRIYNFYLRSDPVDSRKVPHLTVYMGLEEMPQAKSFQFNTHEQPKIRESKKINSPTIKPDDFVDTVKTPQDYLKSLGNPQNANTNYKIYGDAGIAPFAVYDDGAFTYFDYRHVLASDRLPVVYKVVDEYDTIVNFRMDKGFLVAESLAPEGWTLRNGEKTICIKPTKDISKFHGQPERPQMK